MQLSWSVGFGGLGASAGAVLLEEIAVFETLPPPVYSLFYAVAQYQAIAKWQILEFLVGSLVTLAKPRVIASCKFPVLVRGG